MPNNKLSDLNNHLFAQIEKLTDEGLSDREYSLEIEKSKALTTLSNQVVNIHKTVLQAVKMASEGDLVSEDVKRKFDLQNEKSKYQLAIDEKGISVSKDK